MLLLFIFSFVTISFLAFRVRFRISLSLVVICSTDRYLAFQLLFHLNLLFLSRPFCCYLLFSLTVNCRLNFSFNDQLWTNSSTYLSLNCWTYLFYWLWLLRSPCRSSNHCQRLSANSQKCNSFLFQILGPKTDKFLQSAI